MRTTDNVRSELRRLVRIAEETKDAALGNEVLDAGELFDEALRRVDSLTARYPEAS